MTSPCLSISPESIPSISTEPIHLHKASDLTSATEVQKDNGTADEALLHHSRYLPPSTACETTPPLLVPPDAHEPPSQLLSERWWPAQLTDDPDIEEDSISLSPPVGEPLDFASQTHLRTLLFYALSDEHSAYRLTLFLAIVAALSSISQDHILSALRRTACITAKAEAQLRLYPRMSAETSRSASPKRSRFGWPGAINHSAEPLSDSRVSRMSQRLATLLSEVAPSSTSADEGTRRRDVAQAMLSNALWLVSLNASTAGVPSKTSQPLRQKRPALVPSNSSNRGAAAKRTGLPLYLAPSAPTTALSVASSSIDSSASHMFAEPPPADLSDVSIGETREGDVRDSSPTRDSLISSEQTSKSPSPTSSRISSRALDELSSFKVPPRSVESEEGAPKAKLSVSGSSSLSSRDTMDVGAQGSAAARDHGEDSAVPGDDIIRESAKVVVATFCVVIETTDLERDDGVDFGSSKSSAVSVKSDRTLGRRQPSGEATPRPSTLLAEAQNVRWQSGVFRGENLSAAAHDMLDLHKGEADQRIKREGGTFVIRARSEEDGELVKDTLRTALYVALSMVLETSFLRDMGHVRVRPTTFPTIARKLSMDSQPSSTISQRLEASEAAVPSNTRTINSQSRWSKGLWSAFRNSSAAVTAALYVKQSTPDHAIEELPHSPTHRLFRTSTTDGTITGGKLISGVGAFRPRANTKDSRTTSITSRMPSKLGRFFKEQRGPQTSIDGLPDEVDESFSTLNDVGDAPGTVSQLTHDISSSDKIVLEKIALPLGLEAQHDIPLSASHELAAKRNVSLSQARSMSTDAFLQQFSGIQKFAVLVGTQSRSASPGYEHSAASSPVPTSSAQSSSGGGYFTSLSTAKLSVRTLSGPRTGASMPLTPGTDISVGSTPSSIRLPILATPSYRWSKLKREVVCFYGRQAPERDIHLGQVIEAICSRAELASCGEFVSAERAATIFSTADEISRSSAVHYLHGAYRVTIAAKSYSSTGSLIDSANEPPDICEDGATLLVDNDQRTAPAQPLVALAREALRGTQAAEYDPEASNIDDILVWSANARTGEETTVRRMSEATWLFSFAKFLEAVLYHRIIGLEGRQVSHDSVRLFRRGNTIAKVSVAPLTIYQLEIEGPVVKKVGSGNVPTEGQADDDKDTADTFQEEVLSFFALVKNHIELLKGAFTHVSADETLLFANDPSAKTTSEDSITATEPLTRLHDILGDMQTAESELLNNCSSVQNDQLNDIRQHFRSLRWTASRRLDDWRREYLNEIGLASVGNLSYDNEVCMQSGSYALPGSSCVIHEDQPLSIVAYSLSSHDYQTELAKVKQGPDDFSVQIADWQSKVATPGEASSRFSSVSVSSLASYMQLRKQHQPSHIPVEVDRLGVDSEMLHTVMKRKKRGKEASILSLTLRKVGSNITTASTHLNVPQACNSINTSNHERCDLLSASGIDPSALYIAEAGRMPSREKHFTSDTISSSHTNSTFRAQISQTGNRSASLGSMFSTTSTCSEVLPITPEKMGKGRTSLTPPSTPQLGDARPENLASRPSGGSGTAVESPHVKHNVYRGRTKISCVSWFAEEFASLRQKWGVEEDFVASLSQSSPWLATGGKSRSVFFKTWDRKWIGKQLLAVWNVDEKDALLEFAPAYIRYMLNSYDNDCPSLLVKIAGFYSVKIKDMKTGQLKLKMSVMVLENLFADGDEETIKFDLKGIKERRATKGPQSGQPSTAPPSVLYDAEWIETFQSKAFVAEEEKQLFSQALRNDLSFLTESNVMDFSLLVGVNEHCAPRPGDLNDGPVEGEVEGAAATTAGADGSKSHRRPSIRVRIVDYISAFTLAKQVESSSKKAMKSTAEAKGSVTVLPPSEYAARFEAAMLGYFVGVPGTSSTALGESVGGGEGGGGRRGRSGARDGYGAPTTGGTEVMTGRWATLPSVL